MNRFLIGVMVSMLLIAVSSAVYTGSDRQHCLMFIGFVMITWGIAESLLSSKEKYE